MLEAGDRPHGCEEGAQRGFGAGHWSVAAAVDGKRCCDRTDVRSISTLGRPVTAAMFERDLPDTNGLETVNGGRASNGNLSTTVRY